jgi:hypothetical protein
MPNPEQISEAEWEGILRSATVLRDGEMTLQAQRFKSHFDSMPAGAVEGGPQNLTAVMPHTLTIAGQSIKLGYLRLYAGSVSAAWTQADDSSQVDMTLSPFRGDSFEVRFVREGSSAGDGNSPAAT